MSKTYGDRGITFVTTPVPSLAFQHRIYAEVERGDIPRRWAAHEIHDVVSFVQWWYRSRIELRDRQTLAKWDEEQDRQKKNEERRAKKDNEVNEQNEKAAKVEKRRAKEKEDLDKALALQETEVGAGREEAAGDGKDEERQRRAGTGVG
jgi:hypothetical protein